MANKFGEDILIQAPDPVAAASFYVDNLGFEISEETANMVSLHVIPTGEIMGLWPTEEDEKHGTKPVWLCIRARL